MREVIKNSKENYKSRSIIGGKSLALKSPPDRNTAKSRKEFEDLDTGYFVWAKEGSSRKGSK